MTKNKLKVISKKLEWKTRWIISFNLLLIALTTLSAMLFWQVKQYKKLAAERDELSVKISVLNSSLFNTKDQLGRVSSGERQQTLEVTNLIAKISKFIQLPNGEKPTLATINKSEELRNQPFFKDAKNGDRILIYSIAKKAVLYRESTDQIVNYGPVANSEPATGLAQDKLQ